ncbi:5-oxoprolinase subunit PxpA [Aestuariirhabdus litorea]|uniref:5-oxoprolinase subunit PxpA n=1 Tax=Aestuariirhabdus litorea TaxID=2528527 RepID=A0A3P3VJZ4_9GAMM|nr:5-oxoprolinase subunit PxpA [Aestuariirhabdus litorea]RRJ83055.1 5-oxoprolinase subunit PxpA [Aestuariirhabdus litorea]RWW93213.1 5-oxoprolinase subunit PxpA [Endozoicomonadaceae bacterium GTF-13]
MLRLNCDLGESFGAWTMGMDAMVMPHIDQANIACGFHAGDPVVMQQTLALAKQHGVMVGAHPGYHDLVGFGRRSMNCQPHEIEALLMYQVSALDGMARVQGMELEYVKPHGALYNDMMANEGVRAAIMGAIASYHRPLVLMLQATPQAELHREEAERKGIKLWFEAFADRCYDDDGRLLARTRTGAVHSRERMLEQVQQLAEEQTVTTVSGHRLSLSVDTLCVHGDNAEGVAAIEAIREAIS